MSYGCKREDKGAECYKVCGPDCKDIIYVNDIRPPKMEYPRWPQNTQENIDKWAEKLAQEATDGS